MFYGKFNIEFTNFIKNALKYIHAILNEYQSL